MVSLESQIHTFWVVSPLIVGEDGEAPVGAAAVEAGQDGQFGAGEAPLRAAPRLVAEPGQPVIEPAQLLVGEASPGHRGAHHLGDAVERDQVAVPLMSFDESFQATGDPGAPVGVDNRVLVLGGRIGGVEHTFEPQEQVDQFAEATGDHQWIHVDPERARRESPFGGPIAHGYLTLSLVSAMLPQVVEMTGFRMGVNYGTEKVRFPAPVPVGARLRYGATLDSATPFDGGIATVLTVTAEVEGAAKPSMVATVVLRRYL